MSKKFELIKFFLKQGKKIAFEVDETVVTYSDLVSQVYSKQKELCDFGVRKGNKIFIDLENCLDFIYLYFACYLSRITIIPISNKYSDIEKKEILNLSKPDFIYNNALKKTKWSKIKKNKIYKKNKSLAIFYTSGSTAEPKGVCHDLDNLILNAIEFNKHNKLNRGVRFLHFLPMGYMAGFLNSILSPILTGGTIIILKKFNALTAFKLIDIIIKKKINIIWLIPSIVNYLSEIRFGNLKKKLFKLNIKKIFVGTAPFHERIKKNFYKKFKIRTLESYGTTELLLISSNRLGSKEFGSGKILNNVKIKINKCNEIFLKSKFAFLGYVLNNKIINLKKGGWFSTGDLGVIKKNCLKIEGRKKNIIIKNGINISQVKLENDLLKIKEIKKCFIKSEELSNGNTIINAFLETKNNKNKNLVKKIIRDKLNKNYLPDKLIFLKKIPVNHIGKVNLRNLKYVARH